MWSPALDLWMNMANGTMVSTVLSGAVRTRLTAVGRRLTDTVVQDQMILANQLEYHNSKYYILFYSDINLAYKYAVKDNYIR